MVLENGPPRHVQNYRGWNENARVVELQIFGAVTIVLFADGAMFDFHTLQVCPFKSNNVARIGFASVELAAAECDFFAFICSNLKGKIVCSISILGRSVQ